MRLAISMVLGLTALAGCTAAPTTKGPETPQRQVMAQRQAMPTLDQMKRLVPATLTPAEAAKKLIRVNPGQVKVPGGDRKTQFLGIYSVPSIYGMYPFSYLGSTWYSPFYFNAGLGLYSSLYSWPYVSTLSYLSYPFTYLGTLGCYAPFGYWPSYGGLIS